MYLQLAIPVGPVTYPSSFPKSVDGNDDIEEDDLKIIKCLLSNARMEIADVVKEAAVSQFIISLLF
jgi:hypothetical protein